MIPDFSNQTLFPTFETCPTTPPPPSSPDNNDDWFLLAQVKDDMTITKPTLVLSDTQGSPFALVFDGLERDDLDFKALGLKKGCTAVVPRAIKTPPREEGKRGFVSVEKGRAGEVKAIPGPLDRVLVVGERLRVGDGGVCESCGATGELMKCTGCGGVRYCSKECQVKGWGEGHKGDCKTMKAVRGIWGV